MNHEQLKEFIWDNYSVRPDYPWAKYPDYEVFRHSGNRKWFAIIMSVPEGRLGLKGDGIVDIVNFKCEQALIGSFLGEEGFYPAYHMSKSSWITAALDGSVSDNKIKLLLDMSYEATAAQEWRLVCRN